jgi:hypothetical protein
VNVEPGFVAEAVAAIPARRRTTSFSFHQYKRRAHKFFKNFLKKFFYYHNITRTKRKRAVNSKSHC